MDARDAFADKAANGLNQLQKALPFLAAANAATVASSNNGSSLGAEYLALAVLVPTEGEKIGIDSVEEADKLEKAVDEQADDLERAAKEAEEAAQEANEAKMRAFSRDCGDDPSYCMYERARTLSSIEAADNPLYRSVDAWSFSVPLKRAQAYYASRLAEEAPEGASVEEQARSALRGERFYRFASSEVGRGYVHETEGSFDAFFPQLPKNTDEMRLTALYTETAYPVTMDSSGSPVMHAWAGCPQAGGATARGSIAQMEAGGYAMCPACGFTAASMGKVAAASTSIENGFEYHYVAVAQAAEDYQKARARLDPRTAAVKNQAQGLLDLCKQALEQVGGQRIDAAPPGRLGVVVMVANMRAAAASTGFEARSCRKAACWACVPPSPQRRWFLIPRTKGDPFSRRCSTALPKTGDRRFEQRAWCWTAGPPSCVPMPRGSRLSKQAWRRRSTACLLPALAVSAPGRPTRWVRASVPWGSSRRSLMRSSPWS